MVTADERTPVLGEPAPPAHDDEGLAAEWRRGGATDDVMIRDAVALGLAPSSVAGDLDNAAGFISASVFHDLGALAAVYLEQGQGDPDLAWELWAADSADE
ncbi:hypothetical protein [Phycicoccus avicenniae]|uniref:hypothetical protein n=1 Tax=Phycicoccus avicenniae TaxID=2828860 RepID=UPI003D27ABAA